MSFLSLAPAPPDLRALISRLVDALDRSPSEALTVAEMSRQFGIKLRRLYDIMNVFSAVGCCRKSETSCLFWLGRSQLPQFLTRIRSERQIDSPRTKLAELFVTPSCGGISNLTLNFLLVFSALRIDRVDLRLVANLFARGTARFRPILCKLYQVAFVLSAARITARTSQVCEVMLMAEYIDFEVLPVANPNADDPVFVEAMLNHRTRVEFQFVYERREEMRSLWEGNPQSRTGLVVGRDVALEQPFAGQ
jgi:hypothetical protein